MGMKYTSVRLSHEKGKNKDWNLKEAKNLFQAYLDKGNEKKPVSLPPDTIQIDNLNTKKMLERLFALTDSILEKIYNSLDINDINCIVKVSVEKFFTVDIPKPLLNAVKVFKEFILAGKGMDRNLLFRKWTKFRISSRKWEVSDLHKMYEDLISKIFIMDCIVLDEPFYLGEIKNPYTSKVIPSHFTAEALANLTLDNPAANGYLKFHKRRYKEKVKDEIFGDWDKFKVSKKNQKRFR